MSQKPPRIETGPDAPGESLAPPERRHVAGFFERHPHMKTVMLLTLGLAAGIGGMYGKQQFEQRLETDAVFRQRVIDANVPWLSNHVQEQVNIRTQQALSQAAQNAGQVAQQVGSSALNWLNGLSGTLGSQGQQTGGQQGR